MRIRAMACLLLLACGGGSPKKPTTAANPESGDVGKAEAPDPGAPTGPPAQPAPKSLYDRLGGEPAVAAVVDEFVTRTTSDARIKERFFNTDANNLKRLLVEFVCMATGGPCKYTGRDMASSHAGMDLVDEEFTALVENLAGALDKFKVADKEKSELLGALGPLKPDIVVAPDKLRPIPDARLAAGSLRGSMKIDGKTPSGLGVVMLWPERGGRKRTPKQRIIEQRGKQFAPHVMAVPVGSTVSFPNFDPIFHNVFSLSKAKPFDLGMYKNGETREVKLDKPGIVRLGCNLHANMNAYLIVVDAPHSVLVGNDGNFSFKSLAPGKYKVQAWNEQSGEPLVSSVTIKEGTNEDSFDLKGGGQAISPDKFGTARQ
jgi:hemoglobin